MGRALVILVPAQNTVFFRYPHHALDAGQDFCMSPISSALVLPIR
ncbi:MAG: hypothetical protein WDM70_03120 [Nitrosomonadales bacterium]